MIRVAMIALCLLATACAHKAPLKTPSEIAKEAKKTEAKKQRDAARAAKKAEESQEVTVPETGQ